MKANLTYIKAIVVDVAGTEELIEHGVRDRDFLRIRVTDGLADDAFVDAVNDAGGDTSENLADDFMPATTPVDTELVVPFTADFANEKIRFGDEIILRGEIARVQIVTAEDDLKLSVTTLAIKKDALRQFTAMQKTFPKSLQAPAAKVLKDYRSGRLIFSEWVESETKVLRKNDTALKSFNRLIESLIPKLDQIVERFSDEIPASQTLAHMVLAPDPSRFSDRTQFKIVRTETAADGQTMTYTESIPDHVYTDAERRSKGFLHQLFVDWLADNAAFKGKAG